MNPDLKKEEEIINQGHIEEGKEISQENIVKDLDPLQDMILEDQEDIIQEDMNLDQEELKEVENIPEEIDILEKVEEENILEISQFLLHPHLQIVMHQIKIVLLDQVVVHKTVHFLVQEVTLLREAIEDQKEITEKGVGLL